MAEPVRILRLITRLNAGGPARHVIWLTEGLGPLGYETELVTGRVAAGEDDLEDFAREKGVAVRQLTALSREVRVLRDWKSLRQMSALIQEINPDIIHTHTSKAGLLGRSAAAAVNRRRRAQGGRPIIVVHSFHGNVLSGYFSLSKTLLFRSLERWLGRHATDAIVALAPQQASEIVHRFRIAPSERVFLVPLALDLSEFERLPSSGSFRRELGFDPGHFLVGIVGRIAPVKDHPLFLRAAALLARRVPEARFVIVGSGEGLEGLLRLAGELGIGNRVAFTGVRTDLPSIYADLDAVALTSRNEGTPLSLIEAMAAGRPIVATEVGGVRDLLSSEWRGDITDRKFLPSARPRGLLVPAGDADGLASALARIAREPELARSLGEAGREYAFQHHGLPRLFDDLDRLYRKTLLRRPG